MIEEVKELTQELSELLDEELSVEYVDGTYMLEADNLILSFTVDDEFFEIRNIDVLGNTGLGRQVINVIHEYADENNLEVVARQVRDTAQGFWQKMGYQEGGTDEYFRVV